MTRPPSKLVRTKQSTLFKRGPMAYVMIGVTMLIIVLTLVVQLSVPYASDTRDLWLIGLALLTWGGVVLVYVVAQRHRMGSQSERDKNARD